MTPPRRPRVCLFVGPSLTAADIDGALSGAGCALRLLPPVQQGDILRALGHEPDIIAIIDGYFFQVPSVTHKEILLALERGIRVMGASSLGALRAAELDTFGMEGVGEVYRLYATGALDGDDEVAMVHTPDGFLPLTEPLVNLRHNLRRAQARSIVSARTVGAVLKSARRLHFTERTTQAVLSGASGAAAEDEIARLRAFLHEEAVDLKREDALTLLRVLAERVTGRRPWPPAPVFPTNRTVYLHLLQREYMTSPPADGDVSDAMALSFYKLLSASAPTLFERVVSRCLAADEALSQGLGCEGPDELITAFRQEEQLLSEARYGDWLRQRRMCAEELAAALRDRALEQRLFTTYHRERLRPVERATIQRLIQAQVTARTGLSERELTRPPFQRPGIPWETAMLREIKICGEFPAAVEAAARILRCNAELSKSIPGLHQALRSERLEAWCAKRWNVKPALFDRALQDRGFVCYREFLDVARLAYLEERVGG